MILNNFNGWEPKSWMQADACCTSTIKDFWTPPHPRHIRSLNGAWLQHLDHPNKGRAKTKAHKWGALQPIPILPRSQSKGAKKWDTRQQHLGNLLKNNPLVWQLLSVQGNDDIWGSLPRWPSIHTCGTIRNFGWRNRLLCELHSQ